MARILDDGRFEGSEVRVKQWNSGDHGERVKYYVEAAGYIELETTSLELANGIAAALDATVPPGRRYDRTEALWALARLVEARRFLAGLIEAQAETLGKVGDKMKEVATKLYGDRN
jgi:hypothetical protein